MTHVLRVSIPERKEAAEQKHGDMRTHTLWTVALLGLLLWASCSQADDSHPEETQGDSSEETEETEDTEAAPKKEKTTEIEQENNVMVLHDKNFDRALSENQYLLVKFCKYIYIYI